MVHKGKVYVIDDDDAMRDSLDFLLGSAGFQVTHVGSYDIGPSWVLTNPHVRGVAALARGGIMVNRVRDEARRGRLVWFTALQEIPEPPDRRRDWCRSRGSGGSETIAGARIGPDRGGPHNLQTHSHAPGQHGGGSAW